MVARCEIETWDSLISITRLGPVSHTILTVNRRAPPCQARPVTPHRHVGKFTTPGKLKRGQSFYYCEPTSLHPTAASPVGARTAAPRRSSVATGSAGADLTQASIVRRLLRIFSLLLSEGQLTSLSDQHQCYQATSSALDAGGCW